MCSFLLPWIYCSAEKKNLNRCYQTRFLGSKCTQNAFAAAVGADSDMAVIAMEDQYELMCTVSNVVIPNDLGPWMTFTYIIATLNL